jgi:hypothetical protein
MAFVPDEVTAAPRAVVEQLAAWLAASPDDADARPTLRDEFCRLVDQPTDSDAALARMVDKLVQTALGDREPTASQ